MKRIAVCGANGQVGGYLQRVLSEEYEVIPLRKAQLDLTQIENIQATIGSVSPDLVINAAAYTAVDAAESDEEKAYLVNRDAVAEIAKFSTEHNIPFIHYSTDYVFPGEATQPYKEDDDPKPNSVYGASKLAGELAVAEIGAPAIVLRTSWVYSNSGKNFYKTMKRLASERNELSVVADQVGSPTYAGSIAEATKKIVDIIFEQNGINDAQKGVYHFTCTGETSWHGFASELLALNGFGQTIVHPIPTSDFPTPAKRPAYSVLDNSKLNDVFGVNLPEWKQALKSCVAEVS